MRPKRTTDHDLSISACAYAQLKGWRTLNDCSDFLGICRASMSRMWIDNQKRCRTLIAGGAIVRDENEAGGLLPYGNDATDL